MNLRDHRMWAHKAEVYLVYASFVHISFVHSMDSVIMLGSYDTLAQ